MSLLVPAILAKTPEEFNEKLNIVAPFCHKVQVDIMDGIFVPNKTIEVSQIPRIDKPIKLELHLMTKDPLSIFQYEKNPAVSTVIFHFEAVSDPVATLKFMPKRLIKGIAINPNTPVKAIEEAIKFADIVLIMSVEPGFDSQEFIEQTFTKITEVKLMRPGIIIEIDGGVNASNAANIANLGADQVVVGSSLYESKNLKHTIKELMLELGDIEGVAI